MTLGCATGGSTYSSTEVSENEAIVYFYRPARILGAAGALRLAVNGKPLVRLRNGGYFPYTMKPGTLQFALVDDLYQNSPSTADYVVAGVWGGLVGISMTAGMTNAEHVFTPGVLETKGGERYFYRSEIKGMGTVLTRVPNAVGEKEIKACRLLSLTQ